MVLIWGFGTGLCFVAGVWCGAWLARQSAVKNFINYNERSIELNKEMNTRLQTQCDAMVRIANALESYLRKHNAALNPPCECSETR